MKQIQLYLQQAGRLVLDGIKKRISDWAETQCLFRPNSKLVGKKKERRKSIIFVRYADNLAVMNHNLDVIKKCKEIISEFLAARGLELK